MKKIIFKLLFIISAILVFNSTFLIRNCQSQWVQTDEAGACGYAFALLGDNIFAGSLYFGVFRSTNDGINWTQTSLSNVTIYSLATLGNNIFAGMGNGNGVYRSTNNGINWTQTVFSYYPNINALTTFGNNIFAGTSYGIYLSTDYGANWNPTSLYYGYAYSLAVCGNNIIAGLGGSGVHTSSNNGANWTPTTMNNKTVLSLAISGNNIYAGTGTSGNIGVYFSSNNGRKWNHIGLTYSTVFALALSGNNIFAGTNAGVYLSTNNGANWVLKNQGFFGIFDVYSLLIKDNYILAGTSQAVWRRNLSEILTDEQSISSEIPASYSLFQNYPNPFNPVTRIRYDLPRAGVVRLAVYDVMGREIESLVNERQAAGSYEAVWDGTRFASGVYFYRLTAEGYSETRKMILIR